MSLRATKPVSKRSFESSKDQLPDYEAYIYCV